MSPIRHFGNPSRAANSKPYDRPENPSKPSIRSTKPTVNFILNEEHADRPPIDHATQNDLPLATLEPENTSPNSRVSSLKEQSMQFNSPESRSPFLTASPEMYSMDQEGMPTVNQWSRIVNGYLSHLHVRKRDKALITESMHALIFNTLTAPDSTLVGTAQFRFWARKMFQLVEVAGAMVITHGGRPVAVKEHMYDILCMCHSESGHAGRDKTCKVLREYYTWIPKELVANFVKACPTCAKKRSYDEITLKKWQSGEFVISNDYSFDSSDLSTSPYLVKHEAEDGDRPFLTGPLPSSGPNDYHNYSFGRHAAGPSQLHRVSSMPSPYDLEPKFSDAPRRASFPFDSYPPSQVRAPGEHETSTHGDQSVVPFLAPPASNVNNSLPPLVKQEHPNNGLVALDLACQLSRHQNEGNVPLPPLMQYLSGNVDQPSQTVTLNESRTRELCSVPIDPVLLSKLPPTTAYHVSTDLGAESLPSQQPTPLLTAGILDGDTSGPPGLSYTFSSANWECGYNVVSSCSSRTGSQTDVSPSIGESPYSGHSATFYSPIPSKAEKTPLLSYDAEALELTVNDYSGTVDGAQGMQVNAIA